MESSTYVLVTPARNEEAFIEKPLHAVISQTLLPKRWVIVSDGSTDRTDAIVNRYARQHAFIQLVRITGQERRTFSSKVYAFNAGYERLKGEDYAFVGILDADVSVAPDYYERVLNIFRQNPKLGIAGGIKYDWSHGTFQPVLCSKNSVGGPFQLFRRACFEEIGGFLPIAGGGEDAVAEIMARMHGWEVASFAELTVLHYRHTGKETGSRLRVALHEGIKNFLLGYHPLFQAAKSLYRIKEKPYVVGSVLSMTGYLLAAMRRDKKAVPDEVANYLRTEQLARLWSLCTTGEDPALRTETLAPIQTPR
jgi:biofilm PGA synthesis N-glycosyltransferase PgaC